MKPFFFISLFCLIALGEPIPPSETISFDSALKTILERSTAIASQRENAESTKAKNLSSRFSLLPSLSLTAEEAQNHSLQGGDFDYKKTGVGGAASLNIFKFGADAAAMKAASRENESQDLSTADAILKTEDEAIRALIAVIQNELTVQTWNQIVSMREDALKIARERYQRGLQALQEADKFAVDLDNAQSQWHDAQIDAVRARADLTALLGHDKIPIAWPWKNKLDEGLALSEKAKDSELKDRPDWKAAALKLEASHQRMNQAWGQMMPSLDLSLNYGYYKENQPTSSTGPEWMGMATLTIPLFDRLANYGNYESLVHMEKVSEIDLEKTKRSAKSELDAAKGALRISVASAKAREQTLALSRKLYESNLQRFRRAIVNANDLMNDQERLYLSELNAIKGWGESHLNLTRLCHALGRSIESCF